MSSTFTSAGESTNREDPITLSDNSTPTPTPSQHTHILPMFERDESKVKKPPRKSHHCIRWALLVTQAYQDSSGPHAATGLPSRPFQFRAKVPSSRQNYGGPSSPSSLTSSSMPISPPPASTSGSFRYYQPPNIEISTATNDNDSDSDSGRMRDSASLGEASVSKRCVTSTSNVTHLSDELCTALELVVTANH